MENINPKYIVRALYPFLLKKIDYQKAIILLGPRQVGKTTLINLLASELGKKALHINGDDPGVRLNWDTPTKSFLDAALGTHRILVIDEAQRINNIGLSIKMILDAARGVQVLVTGSSSLEIPSSLNEPLTGRKWEYRLYPISWHELVEHGSLSAALSRLDQLLVTGMYPKVIARPHDAYELLKNLADSYLYKDIMELGAVRKPELLLKLLQALAWQMGSEVSVNELCQLIGADKSTVNNYIDLLEKSFVIFRLTPLARNLRNEISSSRKIYFYDNGVRNTLINNYGSLKGRNDVGALWENFVVSERKKKLAYSGFIGGAYFWRNKNQAEIDYVEEFEGRFTAYEIKWSSTKGVTFPKSFIEAYRPVETKVITKENFWEWLSATVN